MRIWYRTLDIPTFLLWMGLTIIGLIAIYSTTHGDAQEFLLDSVRRNFDRQLLWVGVCFIGIVLALFLPVRMYQRLAIPAYVVSIFLLIGALLFGREVGGAKSWIDLGPFSFQSSEIAKVGTLLGVAHLLSTHVGGARHLRCALMSIGMVLLPVALIVLQNDVGTALVYVALIPILLFWGGLPLHIVLLMVSPAVVGYLTIIYWPMAVVVAVLLLVGLCWRTRSYQIAGITTLVTAGTMGTILFALTSILKPHQAARILSFTNPEAEEFRSGVGFHLVQSKAAIGSGGLWGKGFMEGTQTQGRYVSEQSTDFIFSVIGEEWGFVGAMFVLVLFTVFLVRLVGLGSQIKHPFGSVIAVGAAGIYFIHLCINVGMVMGLLPVIGIPLPFLSYGGSALLANTVLLAIVISLHMRRDDFSIYGY